MRELNLLSWAMMKTNLNWNLAYDRGWSPHKESLLFVRAAVFAVTITSFAAPFAWGQTPQDAPSQLRGDVPVPVTVITETMIDDIGARNLKDVLVTYVPGMTFSQDHNEVNVAMRGVYASSQQKFLVLIDGHELN